MDQIKLSYLTPLLEKFVANGPAGCSLMVSRHGKEIYSHYAGKANLDTGSPFTPETLFRVYSMTKVITCTLALMYFERGCFLMSDPVSDYLPAYKNLKVAKLSPNSSYRTESARKPLLIKHLFNMTSGLSYPGEYDPAAIETGKATQSLTKRGISGEKITVQNLANALAEVPLAFEPGTHWRYSLAHDVLGALIEIWSGKTFGQALADELFSPLGMSSTGFRINEDNRGLLCPMYKRDEKGEMTRITDMDIHYQPGSTFESGGGGLLSTLSDYTKFAQMMANGGQADGHNYISHKTIEMMATNTLGSAQMADYNWDNLSGYGYGFGVRTLMDKSAGLNGSIGEFGWSGLAGTWVLIDPSEGLAAVYMQQMLPNLEAYHQPRMRAVIYGAL